MLWRIRSVALRWWGFVWELAIVVAAAGTAGPVDSPDTADLHYCQLLTSRNLAGRLESSYRSLGCTGLDRKHFRSQLARTDCSPADHRIESSSLAVVGFRSSLAGTEVVRNQHHTPVQVGKKLHQV